MEMYTFLKFNSLILLLAAFFLLMGCAQLSVLPKQPPKAAKGVLDLRDWDFEKDGPVYLEGEWSFAWKKFLQPDQIQFQIDDQYVSVPDVWTDYEIDGETITPEGYATYSLKLYTPDSDRIYGLYIDGEGSAYRLWVNGRLLAENGKVGTSDELMKPEKIPYVVFFQPDNNLVELVMHISNFHHRKAGFRNSIMLGPAEPVHRFQLQNWFVEAFSVGILFILALYHLIIFIFRSKNKAPLYFALICLFLAVRTGITNENTLLLHLPILTWTLALRIEYLTFFLLPLLFSMFLKSLYPDDIHHWFLTVVFGSGLGFTLVLLFSNTLTFSYLPNYYQILLILEMIYYFYFLGVIIYRRREGAVYILLASIVLFAATILEMLYFQNILPYGRVSIYGFIAYIFVQAILLSSRSAKSFYKVEALSAELEGVNIHLQQSERKYRHIFEDSKDIIFIAGINGKIEDVNPACNEVLGYTKLELQTMKVLDVIINEEARFEFERQVKENGSVKNYEADLRRKDGEIINCLITVSPQKKENDRDSGLQGSIRDISATKQAEKERLRALKFEQISITDPLTKINNRLIFYKIAEKEIERSKRSGSRLSLIIFDVDYFKNVNDRYGHIVGDEVLVNLAGICQQNIRSMDCFARYGGEEFVILMPDADPESVMETAERLRNIVADTTMAKVGETDVIITISLGIVDFQPENTANINELLNLADKALYISKERGRNRVTVWDDKQL